MVLRFLVHLLTSLVVTSGLLAEVAMAGVQVSIDGPMSGSFVIGGQVVSVAVKVTGLSDDELSRCRVGVIADSGFVQAGESFIAGGFVSRLVVGSNLSSGDYTIFAVVQQPGASSILSAPIVISIAAKPVVGIRVSPSVLDLRFVGDGERISVIGIDSVGREASLSEGDRKRLRFSVSDATVAAVDTSGGVTALSNGLGWVYVKFDEMSASARLMVDVPKFAVRGDFTRDGVVSLVDVEFLRRSLGSSAVGKGDARDLNGDGKVDALDLRILATLCTYPRCASSKP